MQQLEQFREVINTPQKVVITTHHKPDADALGSSLGLALYLKKKGHHVTVITPTDYPKFLHWMEGNDEVVIFTDPGMEAKSAELVAQADLIFCLDFSSLNRINALGELVREAKGAKVLIDHHQNPENFAKFERHDTQAAATAQLVYTLIDDLGDRELIDADIAEALYAGIMTDTGSFKHGNTSKEVHLIVAELMDLGADVSKVSRLIYDNNSYNRLKFLGYVLNERLTVIPEHNTAFFAISAKDLAQFQSQTGDTEGIVNYALGIEGVVFAAMITEREDGVKMSLRSVGSFEVNEFAQEHFNGGGHKNAAGGRSSLSFDETVAKFTALLPQYAEQLQTSIEPIKQHA